MGRSITTLVITVNSNVETEVLGQVMIVTESKHIYVVSC